MGASTGGGGTARAQAHLRDGLAYTNGLVLPLPEVLVSSAAAKFDAENNLTDEETRGEVEVAGFHEPALVSEPEL
jgi:chromate reductase, NAD(P)H dehydrogenase (quinone)